MLEHDISPFSQPSLKDTKIIKKIMRYEATGRAIVEFDKYKQCLTDYCYWFLLSTLCVSYTGWSDLRMWKRLFRSPRPNRTACLMKPSEIRAFDLLPSTVTAYRAKRSNEQDCIAYTLNLEMAAQWAVQRGVKDVHCYTVDKKNILALFLRRNEQEIIVLEQDHVDFMMTIAVEIG